MKKYEWNLIMKPEYRSFKEMGESMSNQMKEDYKKMLETDLYNQEEGLKATISIYSKIFREVADYNDKIQKLRHKLTVLQCSKCCEEDDE